MTGPDMNEMLRALLGDDAAEDWGDYPHAHYDEDDTCQCPDHKAMRRARKDADPS